MPSHHHYAYSELPERIKRQMARAIADGTYHLQEDAGDRHFYVTRGLGALASCAVLLLSLVAQFGVPGRDSLWSDPGRMLLYAFFLAPLAYLGVTIYRRHYLHRLFGFAQGQYLFGFTLIDARREKLTVVDMTQVREIGVTHQLINGFYSHTNFAFHFRDAASRVWKIHSKKRAERFGQKLDSLQSQSRTAFDRNDIAALLRLDPFFEIRRKNWEAPASAEAAPVSLFARVLAQPWLAALVIAAVAAPLAWTVRTAAADVSMQRQAKALATEAAYHAYLLHGKFYVAEMRAAIPRVAFNEVRTKHSVTALRAVLARYPKAGLKPDVAKEIHLLYQSALARFTEQAATSDPALLASMGQLLQVLEHRGDPRVGIRFVRPTNAALAELDARIKLDHAVAGGREIIPAAAHFASDSAAAREARIVTGLQGGFAKVFPNDVLALQLAAENDTKVPALTIDYQIVPSGALYTLEKTQRAFVGLVARFQSSLQVTSAGDPWQFNMEVEPPEHFRVEYTLEKGEVPKGPPDSQVYSVMAERAFDALSTKMRAAFFRQDSAAYKGMNVVAAGPKR